MSEVVVVSSDGNSSEDDKVTEAVEEVKEVVEEVKEVVQEATDTVPEHSHSEQVAEIAALRESVAALTVLVGTANERADNAEAIALGCASYLNERDTEPEPVEDELSEIEPLSTKEESGYQHTLLW